MTAVNSSTEESRRYSIEVAERILGNQPGSRVTTEQLVKTAKTVDDYIANGAVPATNGVAVQGEVIPT